MISKHKDQPYIIYFPVGDGDYKEVLDMVISDFEKNKKEFCIRISNKSQIDKINFLYPEMFKTEEDVNSNDYVYNVTDLIELKGKKYHSKRNFINRFEKYNYVYERMTPMYKSECLELFKKWYSEKSEDIVGIDEHFEAVSELINNWENLDITGSCIRVDGKMVAFSFGEAINDKMVVVHLEHADINYDGSFPMMNKLFLENEWKDFIYVNREEDMGLEGMRRAKKSYHPCHMARKYLAKLK